MNVLEIERRCREALDNPLPQHPTPFQLRDVILRHVVMFRNLLRNSSETRFAASVQMTLDPGQDEFQIPVGDLGTLIYAHRNDPDRLDEPGIEFIKLQNFPEYDNGPLPAGKLFTPRLALIEKAGVPHFKMRPETIRESISITVWYEPAQTNAPAGEFITFPQHHHYIIARVVADVLPLSQWIPMEGDKSSDMEYMSKWLSYHQARRKELAAPHLRFATEAVEVLQRDAQRSEKPRVVDVSSGYGYETGAPYFY